MLTFKFPMRPPKMGLLPTHLLMMTGVVNVMIPLPSSTTFAWGNRIFSTEIYGFRVALSIMIEQMFNSNGMCVEFSYCIRSDYVLYIYCQLATSGLVMFGLI